MTDVNAARIERNPRLVAVAHGRDGAARQAVFHLLRAVGLEPLEWETLVSRTNSAAPYSGDAVERGFAAAQAVIVLFTPDDVVQLHPNLAEAAPVLQARPNVLLEAGMALATQPDRTLLVVIGEVKLPSNLHGRNLIRLNGKTAGVNALANRLETAGCPVARHGSDWLDTASFAALDALERRVCAAPVAQSSLGGPANDAALSVFVRPWRDRDAQHIDVVASNTSGRPLTVLTMGLDFREVRNGFLKRSWRVEDGNARPSLRAVLQDGATVVMTWTRDELGKAFLEGREEIVGCFALDGRGTEVTHTLPEPIRVVQRAPFRTRQR